MNFYGVVDSRLNEAVELFLRREDAERVVRDWDEMSPSRPACCALRSSSSSSRRTSAAAAAA